MVKGGGIMAFDQCQHHGVGLIVDPVRAAFASAPTQWRAGGIDDPPRSHDGPASVSRRSAPSIALVDAPTACYLAPSEVLDA